MLACIFFIGTIVFMAGLTDAVVRRAKDLPKQDGQRVVKVYHGWFLILSLFVIPSITIRLYFGGWGMSLICALLTLAMLADKARANRQPST